MINGSGDRASQIVKSQAYNAFGEIISETDGNGNTSSLSYNTMGKLTKKVLPTVDIRKSDGTVVQGTPTLEYGYDLSGRLLTSKDANGNINKQSYLNGRNLETGDWLVEKETHADTGEVSNLYDVYGNLIEQSNALGVKTGYSYDINGNLIQITRAARTTGTVGATHITSGGVQTSLIDTFTYDELGNRLSATNALKNTTTTDYDALGRVVQSKTAEGITTKVDYVYDATISSLNGSKGGIKRTETDGLGKTVVDEQDYFGRTIKHTDKGAHVFTYTYNAGGWLTKQTNSQGQSLEYSYYSNGSVKEIRDTALNLLTSYRYDDNGNRIEERYQDLNAKTGELRVFQNALINYDSLNRKISVQDQSFNIHYEYDGNGNIVHMLANYRDAVNAAPKIQDFWYSYDSMNRFTISMGVLNSTAKKVERGNTGIAISYDKLGQRLTADYGKDALNSTKAHKESYSYTTDGYLETVKNADYTSTGTLGTQYTVSTRYNDALGRVTQYTDNNENSETVYQTTTTTYSKDNQITEQKKEGGTGAGTTKYTYLADKATLDKTVMTPTSGSIQTTQYAYEWWDSAKQSKITTTVDGLKGETSLSYNINGHLSGFVDDRNTNNRRVATYINNSQGMVLQRNELINDSINRYRNFYYVNGQRVGDLSNDGPTREDYVQNLQSNRATATQAKDFKPISSADFDQNFEPINAQYPSSASTSYVVNNGDTLQSIALSVWGDASMWYMLADVNGLSATDKLTAGQVLTVPNKVTNIHNNSETFRPYNPGEAIGNTQPTVPSPPPPPKPKKKCGGIAQIVMIVVAIVVTIYTAGAAAGLMAGLGSSAFGVSAAFSAGLTAMSTSAVAAGIGAAVGSAASQLAGKAMGVVDNFSWKQVGISALTAAATAGVGGALSSAGGTAGTTGATATQSSWASAAKTAINNGGWVAKGAVSGVISYGTNYLANQVFGNNQSFSWASLGSSIVGSIAATGMGAKGVFERLGTTASQYAYSLAGAHAAAVIDDKWFGGAKPDYLNVSMAAIANAGVRQFGESSSSSQYKSNITVYNPATGERTALGNTPSLYAYSGGEFIDDLRNFNWSGIRDGIREEFFDYKPNNSRESSIALVNGANSDVTQLPTIKVKANTNNWLGDPNIVYALGGVNSTYNMTAALAGIQQKAIRQGAEVRPLNGFDAFYQTKVGSYINAYKTGGVNLYKGLYATVRETIYTSYDVSVGSIIRDINPDAKPASWFAQSVENNGVISTAKDMVDGTVTGVLEPLIALNQGDYVGFTETIPSLITSVMGARVSFLPTKSNRFNFQVNQQGIPYSYLENISDITGSEIKVLEGKYYALEASGADYKSLIRDYVDSNKFGVNLEDAHYIMGYTTNFFQKDLNSKLFTGEGILSTSEIRTINSLNTALEKLPSQSGTFYRGLGNVPDWFDYKYEKGMTVYDNHFSSISRELSENYKANRIMEIHASNAKDISALAMDVNFAQYINQTSTTSEFVMRSGTKYKVLDNDGVTKLIIKEK
ncbi:LysM peptidoglycan-binding domain-containing protein [Acinetobacter lactucae]|uniref:LysM peptidoglycan-binding domain-containing protein n=1 Tax=Acinetobacter lactucae TaxID=1785128 RepID=UPI0013DB00C3|nr:LysM peptidoglycan-binding domain-containing protein [Acinetobacter lactucae]